MTRILVLTVAHPPEDARIRHREIRALLDHGHQVSYAAPFQAFGSGPRPDIPGLRTLDLRRSSGAPHRRVLPVLGAARLAVREGPRHDVVLVHDPELLPVLAVLRLARWARRCRLPVLVWDVHEDLAAQVLMVPLPRGVQLAAARALRGAEALAERAFRLLLAETAYQDRFRCRHPVVPNSVRVPAGPSRAAEAEPRVVYLGALTRERGSAELIAIAERLPQVTVEVLGNAKPDVDAELRLAMRRLPNLAYRGFVPNSEALQRLPGALGGLSLLQDQPNYAHSQPTKVMEYMAHGVPVITTPNEASRVMVTAAHAGEVIGFGDVDAAVETIQRWDADRVERDRLGANGRAFVLERHNWERDGARFSETIQDWVDRAGAPGG